MRFRRLNNGLLEISAQASAILLYYRQTQVKDLEAGGVLLGRLIIGGEDVIIDEITVPAPGDRRSRFFFFRQREAAQRRVQAAWQETQGTRIYMGEWHTHPEDDPTPSSHDLKNWRRIIKLARYEQDSLFFVIVGRKQTRVWEIYKEETNAVELEAISSTI
jgi:integrative and conjugative element protein (TIGR02256 family)